MNVRGFGKGTLILVALLVLPSAFVCAQTIDQANTDDRQRAVRIARELERDQFAAGAEEDRNWFVDWMVNGHGTSLDVGWVAEWCVKASCADLGAIMLFQFMLSSVAFQIENPDLENDKDATDLAGLEGVLRSYRNLLVRFPKIRTANMDEALLSLDEDRLAEFLRNIRAKQSPES